MKPSTFTTFTGVAALMLLPGVPGKAVAATFIGPLPYRAFDNSLPGAGGAISPFVGEVFGYFHLETFEDHLLNTPGVSFSASPGSGVTRVVSGPAFVDSVDADDGVIDGSGLNGDSFFGFDGGVGIRFTFNAGALGALPTHVGIVWTDGYFSNPVHFQAFGPSGNLLGTIGPTNVLGQFPDNSFNGETAEDRFFGVINAEGISSILISCSIAGIEVDHLQYGFKPNTAPQFTKGPDVTVSENAGPQTITGWATGISPSTPPGIPTETNQTVQFLVSNDNPGLFSAQPALNSNGTLTFTPAPNACGLANVGTVAKDNGGTALGGDDSSDPQLFAINVGCRTNTCPTANPLSVSVNQGGQINFQLPASDPDSDPLQFNITQPPAHGVVVVNVNTGAGSYTPNAGYCGPDSFGYGVRDGRCTNVVAATVSITVVCPNQCPTAAATLSPTVSIGCVGLSNVVIAANNTNACVVLDGTGSTDPDGDALGYSWIFDGTIAVQLSGTEEVPPNASSATGSGAVTLAGTALTVNISFSGLSANWTAAHIHGPAGVGTNAAVLINLAPIATGLGTTAGTFNGVVNLTPDQVTWLRQGLLYVNVHTTARPGGEIRSQIAPLVGATVTSCLPFGTYEVCLTVNDGRCADTQCVTVEVISPCQAVGTLVAVVEGSSLSRNHQRPLIASLKATCASFERGELDAGANQLQAFQNKVRAQVAPSDAALAQHLIECAQAIIDALGGS